MKLVTFATPAGVEKVGALRPDRETVVDLSGIFSNLLELIDGVDGALEAARQALTESREDIDLKDVRLILGPYLVTRDEIPDPCGLAMIARVNGEEWGRGRSGVMHHTFEQLIAYVSRCETLYPGEVLGSGTVGNGCGLELGRFLNSGDVIELQIDGLGMLRNRIVKPG